MEFIYRKIKNITKIQKKTETTNFSVKKNENYFANGILTHNCYMKRHMPEGLTIATNINQILSEIDHHAWFAVVDKPNQTHDKYITYDISCNEDFALHAKYYDVGKIFEFFAGHEIAYASFATKFVNESLLEYNPKNKVRIRFSLMPSAYSKILEPKTSPIMRRIGAINEFAEAGYDVHINFSPVIYTPDFKRDYAELFQIIDKIVLDKYKDKVHCEVIFLTHNEAKHEYNVKNNLPGESMLWNPKIQESKISSNGETNIRYGLTIRHRLIKEFTQMHDEIIPWNKIRYIF